MRQYEILKDFKGSQTGSVTEQFKAGEVRELSDYLAGIVVPEGWARPSEAAAAGEEAAPRRKVKK